MVLKIKDISLIPNQNVFIDYSRNGRGIFSNKFFKEFESILKINGILFNLKEEESLDYKTKSNSIRYDKGYYLNPKGNYVDCLNHSCNPNSFIKKSFRGLFLFSFKKINPLDEITIDYSIIIALDDKCRMNCNCESDSCRNIIGDYTSIPKDIFQNYLDLKLIQKYILDINSLNFKSNTK